MPIRILKKDKNKSDPKKRFDPRTGEETDKPGGKDPRTIYRPDAKEDIKPTEMNTGGDIEVKQLDPLGKRLSDVGMMGGVGKMNKFVLRNQKKAIQKIPNKNFKSPTTSGKEQKKLAIKEQKNIESKMTRKGQEYKPVITRSKGGGADTGKVGEIKSRILTAVQRAARRNKSREGMTGRPAPRKGLGSRLTNSDIESSMKSLRRSRNEDRITNRDIETASSAIKGYSKGMSKEDITREGKRGIAAGKALGESLRDKNSPMKRQRLADRQLSKKMGGGMMQRPMGYKSGTMVKARGCKLGRTKKTKLY